MTRLVCIGDCHFGPQGGRNDDRYRALDQIIAHGRRLSDLGGWLMAGDLFHAKSAAEDRNAIVRRLKTMAALGPVILLQGNHDQAGELDIFAELATAWPISVASVPQVLHVQLATRDRAAVWCLPYVYRAGLVSAGVMHASLGDEARRHLEPIFMAGAAELEAAAADGAYPVMLGHIAVGGAVMSTGQPAIGREIELDPALLARLGSIPKILGHIHKAQEIHGAVYLGSITRQDFGEREAKSFGVLEYSAPSSWTLQIVPLDVPGMVHVEGRLTSEAFAIETVDGEPPTAGQTSTGLDVRVRYRYVQAEIRALDVAKIHAEFAGCRSLKLDGVPELAHQVRAPEIAAATTIDEKVERYCALHGLEYSEGLRAKLAALLTKDATAVQADVVAAAGPVGDVEPQLTEVA